MVWVIYRANSETAQKEALSIANYLKSENINVFTTSCRPKGNFFSTLDSNSDTWVAHQRASSKRVQSIGFNPSGNLWMLSRGAEIRFNDDGENVESWTKPIIPILNGYNYLDLGWDPNGDIWAGGGNGTLIVSKDKGKTWNSDPIASSLPTNFIKIDFLDKDQIETKKGFILGERGYILKWAG